MLENNGPGILLAYTNNSHIENCTVSNGYYANISLKSSSNNTISNNLCENNSFWGISLENSPNNTLSNNILRYNETGIANRNIFSLYETGQSDNLTLINNVCENNNFDGIVLIDSGHTLTNNLCENNRRGGLWLSSSSNNTLRNNLMNNNGEPNFHMYGGSISHFDHDIDTSNLINGRPIYYLKDNADEVIGPSLNAGYLALIG